MACVTLEDFVRPNTNWREVNYKRFSQFLVVLFGIFYILFAYLASVVGGLIKVRSPLKKSTESALSQDSRQYS